MRLHELRSERDSREELGKLDRLLAAHKLVKQHGFNPLTGAFGSYSSILVHPDLDYIIKLFDAKDTGYMVFLRTALAHADNPHFPRFRGKPMQISPQLMGIRIEKLKPMQESEYDSLEYMLYQAKQDPSWLSHIRPDGEEREFLDRWPRFAEALDILRSAKQGTRVGFDWHDGNMMKRSDGTPVIIDPFVSG